VEELKVMPVIPLRAVLLPIDMPNGMRGHIPMRVSVLCITCHHLGDVPKQGLSCAAFPDSIPKTILEGEHDHREPFPGDQDIRYELAPRVIFPPELEPPKSKAASKRKPKT
jgi:hypothetical protein